MLLTVANLTKAFGPDVVLTGVNFRLDIREKVALVGRNGTGKTTLLKAIAGLQPPDTGSVQLSKGGRVGYLRQESPVTPGRSVLEEAQAAVEDKFALKARLEALEKRLEEGPTADELDEYALLQEHYADSGAYSLETDVKVVLNRLGFEDHEFEKRTESLSGGEKTRLALARILLEEPELLILDEPTNHLDLQATEWLENWVRAYHGTVLIVSHDRAFLENTAERFLELREKKVFEYPGPYAKYRQVKAEEDARLTEVNRRQSMEIAKMDEYVRRFMNSQRTAQARGRQKLMNRLIENRVEAPKAQKGIKGGFQDSKRSGDVVMKAEKLSIGYQEPLVSDLEWTVRNGERWGIIGENGIGKSTLVRVMLGRLDALSGSGTIGSNVVLGYFSQDAADFDLEQSPIDLMVYEMDMSPLDARTLLGRFLITGDDVYRPIKTLSGGEKNKLSLACLTHLNPNLLVLDEPTNHLDMDSRDALVGIINEFKGTLVLVSHDRWLLSQITDRTLDLRKAGAIQFLGGYADYRMAQKRGKIEEAPTSVVAPSVKESTLSPREVSKEIARLQKRVSETEEEVATAERQLRQVEKELESPNPAKVVELSNRYQIYQIELQVAMKAWETETLKLEELTAIRG